MKKGSERSFAQAFVKHRDELKRFLSRRGVNPEDSEDIIQETFLRCYPLLEKNPDSDLQRLFVTVARNLHVDAYRRGKRYARGLSADYFEALPDSRDDFARRLKHAALERILEAIQDQPDSHFFKLHYQNGYKIREIAALTQTAKGTVSSQIFRFRHRMEETICAQLDAVDELLA